MIDGVSLFVSLCVSLFVTVPDEDVAGWETTEQGNREEETRRGVVTVMSIEKRSGGLES